MIGHAWRLAFAVACAASAMGCKSETPEAPVAAPSASAAVAEPPPDDEPTWAQGAMGVTFSRDGARMIVGDEVRDTANGQRLAKLTSARRATFSPDGSAVLTLAYSKEKDAPAAWNLEPIGGAPRRLAAAQVEWLASGASVLARDGGKLWLHTPLRAEPLGLGAAGEALELASSARTLVVGDATEFSVVDLAEPAVRARVRAPFEAPRRYAIVDEHVIACGGDSVFLAKVAAPSEGRVVKVDGAVRVCAGRGARLFVGTTTGLSVIDVQSGSIVTQRKNAYASASVTPSHDGRFVHTEVVAFDVEQKREMRAEGDHPFWAPRAPWVAVERESSVAVFDASTGRNVAWLRGSFVPWRAQGTPWADDASIATVHDDALTIWRLPDAKPRARIPLRGWDGAPDVVGYGGVEVTAKLATFFVRTPTETRVAVVRLRDLSTVWLRRRRDGGTGLTALGAEGSIAPLEALLRD